MGMVINELYRIQVADIVISVSCSRPQQDILFPDSSKSFTSDLPPQLTIHTSFNDLPDLDLSIAGRIFYSATVWSLFQFGRKKVLLLGASSFDAHPDGFAIFDSDFKDVQLFKKGERLTNGLLPDPLQYPLGEVLMICMLAKNRGLMVHACGIDDDGRGYLFAGNSTHGKSTLARLWKDRATILNDDRIILRKRDGRFWMYGTPWHGDFNGVSPNGVPLEKIFFLRHAPGNAAHQTNGASGASMLLSRSFPPLWDKPGMRFTLDFSDQLIESIPFYVLDFVPDQSIIDYIRCVN